MRELTSNWYLKKNFFSGYKIMVEVNRTNTCEYDFSQSPEFTCYEKATDRDLIELGITTV